jgi:hypothetical protein
MMTRVNSTQPLTVGEEAWRLRRLCVELHGPLDVLLHALSVLPRRRIAGAGRAQSARAWRRPHLEHLRQLMQRCRLRAAGFFQQCLRASHGDESHTRGRGGRGLSVMHRRCCWVLLDSSSLAQTQR